MKKMLLAVSLLVVGAAGVAQEIPPTARELKLMVGAPPAESGRVTIENFLRAPHNRWGLQHIREVVPTRPVLVGESASALAYDLEDLSDLTVTFPDDRTVTVGDWLAAAYTDGFMVLHDGRVVFERYFNDQTPGTQHLMFSVTKSFTGTIMLMLIEQGRVDESLTIADYLPELAASAFGDATIAEVLDMTNSIEYVEDYTDPDAHIAGFLAAMMPGGEGLYSNLASLTEQHPDFEHGDAFHYVTPDPDVLGWVIRRVIGKNIAEIMHEFIWGPLGAAYEGNYWLDFHGVEMAGGGLSITLQDAARFGQMILQDGEFDGRRVLQKAVARRIKTKRNAEKFGLIYDDPWYGGITDSYHDQWWGYLGRNAVAALGVHGQFIYINSDANVVIAKQTSDPDAESFRVDTETALVMHAIADHLQQ